MGRTEKSIRVLYSFPHKLGADRICYTAWQQVNGLAAAGADVLAFPGVLHRSVPPNVVVRPTLSWGKARISYRLFGTMRALALHDWIVARRIEKLKGKIDLIHTWPCAAMKTLGVAAKLGIPTVLERPNAHTRFAYEAVGKEFKRLGVPLPKSDEYSFKPCVLRREEEEYRRASYILCPSDFVVRTFLEHGFPRAKLARHIYGYDEHVYHPDTYKEISKREITMLFVGVCAVRKGVHFALEAWLNSPASRDGTFLIAGEFLQGYADALCSMLSHPSVKVLGHRNDVADLMRKSDLLVLPSIEEGFGLVVAEAMGSGCVPLVSEACTDIVRHAENGLTHPVGNVATLTKQITMLYENPELLGKLRSGSLTTAPTITWTAAGERLLQVYRDVMTGKRF